jgi:hypothetical protein
MTAWISNILRPGPSLIYLHEYLPEGHVSLTALVVAMQEELLVSDAEH